MRFTKPLVLFFLLLFAGEGCKKSSSTCTGVPVTAVNFSIDLSYVSYNALTVPGGYVIVSGGYANNGVLIYRFTSSQFFAYDCTCPYDGTTNSKAIVTVQKTAQTATCPVCGSVFILSSGGVSHGPATCGLKPYTATYDGTSLVTITN
jgi:nitrite reductase/ring-hydroxylating ferredoxin subunit